MPSTGSKWGSFLSKALTGRPSFRNRSHTLPQHAPAEVTPTILLQPPLPPSPPTSDEPTTSRPTSHSGSVPRPHSTLTHTTADCLSGSYASDLDVRQTDPRNPLYITKSISLAFCDRSQPMDAVP